MKLTSIDRPEQGDIFQIVCEGEPEYEDPTAQRHLFRVNVFTPVFDGEVYVLASDQQAAVKQARCVFGIASYFLDDNANHYVHAHAVQVPMAIQGWGSNTF